jgi:hypothetical protein
MVVESRFHSLSILMEKYACLEYTRLKEREAQCIETSEWFKRHPEHGELLSKKATERYYDRYLEAHRDCIEHSKQCLMCNGTADDWT